MPARIRSRLSFANLAAAVALFFALGGGTAFAVVAADQVVSSSIKNGEVKTADLGALQVTQGRLAADSVYTGKVADGSLTGADILSNSLSGAQIDENSLDFSILQKRITGSCLSGQAVISVTQAGGVNCAPGVYTDANDNVAATPDPFPALTTGTENSALGAFALASNTSGGANSAVGERALGVNTTGAANTAVGERALRLNTASQNSALGNLAMGDNTSGAFNTAVGQVAMRFNSDGGSNTALGQAALYNNTAGDNNIAVGKDAGLNLTVGSNNIDIGNAGVAPESATIRIGTLATQTRAFVAGVSGTNVGAAQPAVFVTANGQLGVNTSSRRFKRDVRALASRTDRLMKLRPVSFRYKREHLDGRDRLQYGLIAEEVAKVYPDLVSYRDGKPFTVLYQELPALLLAKAQEQQQRADRQQRQIRSQSKQIADLRAGLAKVKRGD